FYYSYIDITQPENKPLWENVTSELSLPKVTPITLIGETIIQGSDKPDTTGKRFISLIDYYQTTPTTVTSFQDYLDQGIAYSAETVENGICEEECVLPEEENSLSIPFLGSINLS